MKKNLLSCVSVLLMFAASAQYKKASFLNKTGRIYDIGGTMRILGNERSSAFGFFVSYGKENADKRVHHWYDTEVMFGSSYKYQTTSQSNPGTPITVTGTTGSEVTIRYNWAYFLTDQSDAETKFGPFVNLALGYTGTWGYGSANYPDNDYPLKQVDGGTSAFIFGGGAGFVYRFTPGIGLRLSAAYYGVSDGEPKSDLIFKRVVNHPAVNLAVRFKMNRGD